MHIEHHMHKKDYQSVTVQCEYNSVGHNGLCVCDTNVIRFSTEVCVCHTNYMVRALKDNYNTKSPCGCLFFKGKKGFSSKCCQFHSRAPCETFTYTHTHLSVLSVMWICGKYWIWFLLFLVLRLIIDAVFLQFVMKNWSTRVRESQTTAWEHDCTFTNTKRLNTQHTHYTCDIQYRPIYCMYAATYATYRHVYLQKAVY